MGKVSEAQQEVAPSRLPMHSKTCTHARGHDQTSGVSEAMVNSTPTVIPHFGSEMSGNVVGYDENVLTCRITMWCFCLLWSLTQQ
jgi:hypothetical protein